jgi:hypothetical protein
MTEHIYVNTIKGRVVSIKGPQPGTPYYRKRVALLRKAGFKLSVIAADADVISTLSIKEIEQAVDMAAEMLMKEDVDFSSPVENNATTDAVVDETANSEGSEDREVRRMKKLAYLNNQRTLAILRQWNDPYLIKPLA